MLAVENVLPGVKKKIFYKASIRNISLKLVEI